MAASGCGSDPKPRVIDEGDSSLRADAGRLDSGSRPDSGRDAGAPTACNADEAPDVGALAVEAVPGVGELSRLVFAAQPPGSSDWYLVQQEGQIRVLSNGQLRAGSFLDLSSEVGAVQDEGDERGLLGLAFAPDYAASGKFYLAMTPHNGANAERDVVVEYRRASEPSLADPASRREILRLDPSPSNHNGGHVTFGPDGMLYVGTGDGGGGCNNAEPRAPQQLDSLFGKILRLDPNASAPFAASGNPFASGGDARVLHYGLRNPFRFNFDRATGDLYIGDVGQDAYEELDVAPSGVQGLNFGWPKYEGAHADTCSGFALRESSTHTPPIDEVDQRMGRTGPFNDWVSVIAGVTYRGSALPQLTGVHLYGDYVGRRMRALRQCASQTSPVTTVYKTRDPNDPNTPYLARGDGAPETFHELTAIVEDDAGEIYFVANRRTLLKLVARE